MNTRRQHGLLVAATRPPSGRTVLLSKLEETLVVGGERFDLSTNRYPGTLHPEGWRFLTGFRLDPFPVWTFEAGGVRLEKSLFMVHGEPAIVVSYRLVGPGSARLELRPLLAFRDLHALTRENAALDPGVAIAPGLASVAPCPDLPPLHVAHDGHGSVTGAWYRNIEYDEDRRRGSDFTEDLFQPFLLRFDLGPGGAATVIVSTRKRSPLDVHGLRGAERARRAALASAARSFDPALRLLTLAADRFLVASGELRSVIAGYPGLGERGRDAMIAIPGLTLATGRTVDARALLLAFARQIEEGLVPGPLPDERSPAASDKAETSLWFVEAVGRLAAVPGETAWIRAHLWPLLREIAAAPDGPAAPLPGGPVEIQALRYAALRTLEGLARAFCETPDAAAYAARADRVKRAFLPLFWNPDRGCLFDAVDSRFRDPSIRPNQLFPISLSHPLLEGKPAASVLDVVTRELLTPYGLRTLSPGDAETRDRTGHEGTVRPWLLGPYVDALFRVMGNTPSTRAHARKLLRSLSGWLLADGAGQLPELFDGDPPHRPAGCPAQAASVAEILRALHRASA